MFKIPLPCNFLGGNQSSKSSNYFSFFLISRFCTAKVKPELPNWCLTPPRIPPLSEDFKLNILYQDSNFLVVDKPRDVRLEKSRFSHIYPCIGTLVENYLNSANAPWYEDHSSANEGYHSEKINQYTSCSKSSIDDREFGRNCCTDYSHRINGIKGLKFRMCGQLDYGTSGVLILSLNKKVSKIANLLLSSKKFTKIYIAMCYGHMNGLSDIIHCKKSLCKPSFGQYDMRLAGDRTDGKYCHSVISPFKHTYYNNHPVTLCELRTITGRRHQLRVHLASLGHPIVGDINYFDTIRKDSVRYEKIETERMMLHCFLVRCNYLKKHSFTRFPIENDVKPNEILGDLESDEVFEIIAEDCISPYVGLPGRKKEECILLDDFENLNNNADSKKNFDGPIFPVNLKDYEYRTFLNDMNVSFGFNSVDKFTLNDRDSIENDGNLNLVNEIDKSMKNRHYINVSTKSKTNDDLNHQNMIVDQKTMNFYGDIIRQSKLIDFCNEFIVMPRLRNGKYYTDSALISEYEQHNLVYRNNFI